MNTYVDWLWSDGWLLMSFVVSANDKFTLELDALLGAADCMNHAIPTNHELNRALSKFIALGLITNHMPPYELSASMTLEIRASTKGTKGLFSLPDAGLNWLNKHKIESAKIINVDIPIERIDRSYNDYISKLRKKA
jgi:hypothetical protein